MFHAPKAGSGFAHDPNLFSLHYSRMHIFSEILSTPSVIAEMERCGGVDTAQPSIIISSFTAIDLVDFYNILRSCGCCHHHSYGLSATARPHCRRVDFSNFTPSHSNPHQCVCKCVRAAKVIRSTIERYAPSRVADLDGYTEDTTGFSSDEPSSP